MKVPEIPGFDVQKAIEVFHRDTSCCVHSPNCQHRGALLRNLMLQLSLLVEDGNCHIAVTILNILGNAP